NVAVALPSSVTDEFIWRDGEISVGEYLRVARLLFRDQSQRHEFEMHDELETVFETFDVVWPLSAALRSKHLAPTFKRGLAIVDRLGNVQATMADLIAILDQMDTAVMLVEPNLRLRAANMAAEQILRREDGFQLKEGQIHTYDRRDAQALARQVGS